MESPAKSNVCAEIELFCIISDIRVSPDIITPTPFFFRQGSLENDSESTVAQSLGLVTIY